MVASRNVIKGTPIKPPSNKKVVKGKTISKPGVSNKQEKPLKAINDLTASARKATANVANQAKLARGSITNSATKGIAKAKDHSAIQAKRAGDVALRSVSKAAKHLEVTSKTISSQTVGLFKHATDNITGIAKGTLNATKETLTTMTAKVGEDISINKENLIAASMYRINPLVGYFASRMASPAVLSKLKESGRKAFEKVKSVKSNYSNSPSRSSSGINDIDEIGDVTQELGGSQHSVIGGGGAVSSAQKMAAKKKVKTLKKQISNTVKPASQQSVVAKFSQHQLLQSIATSTGKTVELLSRLPKRLAANDSESISIIQKDQAGNNIVSKGNPSNLAKLNKLNVAQFKTSWTPTLRSFFKDFTRARGISALGVNEEMQFKSQFELGSDDKKGLITKFVHAYKVATDTYDLSYKDKMLRATLEMKSALAAERKIWPVIRDRMILESAILRNSLVLLKIMKVPFTMPLKVFKWGTKARGGYISKIPKGLGGIEHTAAVLDMIYADSMWRMDNIILQLKRIYDVQSEAHGKKSDKSDDVHSGKWSIFGKIFGFSPSDRVVSRETKEKERIRKGKTFDTGQYQDELVRSSRPAYSMRGQPSKTTGDLADKLANKLAKGKYSKYKKSKLKKLTDTLLFEKEKTLARLAKIKYKEELRKNKEKLKEEKIRLKNLIIDERIKRRLEKLNKVKDILTLAGTPGLKQKRDRFGSWSKDKYNRLDKYVISHSDENSRFGKIKTRIKDSVNKKFERPKAFALQQLRELRLIHRTNVAALKIGLKRFKLGRAALRLQNKIKKKFGSFGKMILMGIMTLPTILKNVLGKFGLGKILKVIPMLGRALLGAKAGAMMGAPGLIMGATDAARGVYKAKKWGTSKTAAGIGGFLGGAGEDSFTVGGAVKGMGKGASIGAMIGSIVPGFGTAIGGAIGAIAGGLLGFIGGKNIAKVLNIALKPVEWLAKGIWKMVTFPFTIMAGVFRGIKKAFVSIKEKGFAGAISELGNWVVNSIKDLMKAMVVKPFNWLKSWFTGDKKPEDKTGATQVKKAKKENKKKGFWSSLMSPDTDWAGAATAGAVAVGNLASTGYRKGKEYAHEAGGLIQDIDLAVTPELVKRSKLYGNKFNSAIGAATTYTGSDSTNERNRISAQIAAERKAGHVQTTEEKMSAMWTGGVSRVRSAYKGAKETLMDKIQRIEAARLAGGSEAGHVDILALLQDVSGPKAALKKKLLKFYTDGKGSLSDKWERIKIALLAGESEAGNIDVAEKIRNVTNSYQTGKQQVSEKASGYFHQAKTTATDWQQRLAASAMAGHSEAGNVDTRQIYSDSKNWFGNKQQQITSTATDWQQRLAASAMAGESEAGNVDARKLIEIGKQALNSGIDKTKSFGVDWQQRLAASAMAGESEAGNVDARKLIEIGKQALKGGLAKGKDYQQRLEAAAMAGQGEAGNVDVREGTAYVKNAIMGLYRDLQVSQSLKKRDAVSDRIHSEAMAAKGPEYDSYKSMLASPKRVSDNLVTSSLYSVGIAEQGGLKALSKMDQLQYSAKARLLKGIPIDKLAKVLPKKAANIYLARLKAKPNDEDTIRAEILSHIDSIAEKQIGPVANSTYIATSYAKQKASEIKNTALETAEAGKNSLKKFGQDTGDAMRNMGGNISNAVNSMASTVVNNTHTSSSVSNSQSNDDSKKSSFDVYIDQIIHCTVL